MIVVVPAPDGWTAWFNVQRVAACRDYKCRAYNASDNQCYYKTTLLGIARGDCHLGVGEFIRRYGEDALAALRERARNEAILAKA